MGHSKVSPKIKHEILISLIVAISEISHITFVSKFCFWWPRSFEYFFGFLDCEVMIIPDVENIAQICSIQELRSQDVTVCWSIILQLHVREIMTLTDQEINKLY